MAKTQVVTTWARDNRLVQTKPIKMTFTAASIGRIAAVIFLKASGIIKDRYEKPISPRDIRYSKLSIYKKARLA